MVGAQPVSLGFTFMDGAALACGFTLLLKNEIVKIAPRGRVNCVAPGWVRTPMAASALKNPAVVYQAIATYVLPRDR